VKLDRFSGLRRSELAELEVRDVPANFFKVRQGKGLKDRDQFLPPTIAAELNRFCEGRKPHEKVFGLSSL
jgi:site-specific recombinase XerD